MGHVLIGHNMNLPICPLCELQRKIKPILDKYTRVADGSTKGAGGSFDADAKSTLNAVSIRVDDLEALAKACNVPVLSRTSEGRQGNVADRV